MKNLIICLSVLLAQTAAALPSLNPVDIGEYSTSFHYSGYASAGDGYLFTIASVMDVSVDTYLPFGAYNVASSPDVCILMSWPDMSVIDVTEGSGERQYASDTKRVGTMYHDLPAGSYILNVMSLSGFFSISGCGRNLSSGHMGEDTGLAYQLGSHGESFSYSIVQNTDRIQWSNYGQIPNDVFFHLSLEAPAYTVIDHWGSNLGLPDVSFIKTRIYIIKVTKAIGADVASRLTEISSAVGSENLLDSLNVIPDAVIEIEEYDPQLACWHGWIDEGEYYFVSEGAYSQGSSVTSIYNGLLQTNIHCFIPEGGTESTAIETGISDAAEFMFTDTRVSSAYRDSKVYYRFSLTKEQSLKISSAGAAHIKNSSGRYIFSKPPGNSDMDIETIGPGNYILETVFPPAASTLTTTICSARFSTAGDSLDNPVELGGASGNCLFYDTRNTGYYKVNGNCSEITYCMAAGDSLTVMFSHGGAERAAFTGYIRKKTDRSIVATAAMTPEKPYFVMDLAAGEYLYTVRCSDVSSVLTTKIEFFGKSLPVIASPAPSSSMNYIMTSTFLESGAASPDAGSSGRIVSIEYYDGLGRPVETVVRGGTSSGSDIVAATEYEYGLPVRSWQPVPSRGRAGGYTGVPDIRSASMNVNLSDTAAYSLAVYDDSYLRRSVKSTGPGQKWHEEGKSTSTAYLVNEASGDYSCPEIEISEDILGQSGRFRFGMRVEGNFPEGQLYAEETVDEDGHRTIIFSDKRGQNVLERRIDASSKADTYFLYDDIGNLRCVIQPMGMASLPESGTVPDSIMENYCWVYFYDSKGRKVSYTTPGSDGFYRIVYNSSGYPVLMQSPVQSERNEWSVSLPDALGREVVSGLSVMDSVSAYGLSGAVLALQYSASVPDPWCKYSLPPALSEMDVHQVNYYDDYSYLATYGGQSLDYVPCPESDAARSLSCKGFLTAYVGRDIVSGRMIVNAYYYDHYGNLCQHRFSNMLSGESVLCLRHDFTGNVLSMKESHGDSLSNVHNARHVYSYDHVGRLLSDDFSVDDSVSVSRRVFYDSSGNPVLSEAGLRSSSTDSYAYPLRTVRRFNVRGQEESSENAVFSYRLFHESPSLPDAIASYSGKLSEWSWRHGAIGVENSYVLSYDGLGRLSGCTLYEDGESSDGSHSENMSFDRNGNLLALVRRSSSGDMLSEYSYGYNGGNRVSGIQLSPVAPRPRARFQYDSNGNMVSDGLHSQSLYYNHLGLLSEARSSLTDSVLVRYSYLPDGKRTGAYFGSSAGVMSDGLLYIGSMIYRKSGNDYALESVSFDGGRVVLGSCAEAGNPSGGNGIMYSVHLHVCDHLGSVRAVVDGVSGAVLERNDYYPSGKRWESSSPSLSSNRWRYNGNEEQCYAGVPYIDYGARMYSPDLCRWTSPDPLSEKYYSLSPYSFCGGDPVNYIDPDGKDIWEIDNMGNIINRVEDKENDTFYIMENTAEAGWQRTGKSISFKSGTITYIENRNYFQSIDEISGAYLFEFLASNTYVEYGLITTLNEEAVVFTDNNLNSIFMMDIANDINNERKTITSMVHSHPKNTVPSGYSDSVLRGDKAVANKFVKSHGYLIEHYVYQPKYNRLIQYDKDKIIPGAIEFNWRFHR